MSSTAAAATTTSTKTRPVSYLRSSSSSADLHMEMRATSMSVAILQYIFEGGSGRKSSVFVAPPTSEIQKCIFDLVKNTSSSFSKTTKNKKIPKTNNNNRNIDLNDRNEEKPWIDLFSSSQGRKVFVCNVLVLSLCLSLSLTHTHIHTHSNKHKNILARLSLRLTHSTSVLTLQTLHTGT